MKLLNMTAQITLATGVKASINHAQITLGQLDHDWTYEISLLSAIEQQLEEYIDELKAERRGNTDQ